MISSEILLGAFLCFAVSQLPNFTLANPNNPSDEDLQEEYYTVIPAVTDKFVPQDEEDAKAIHDSDNGRTTIADIFTKREKVRRYAINVKMAIYSQNHKDRWFSETYKIDGKIPFDDLCFGLIEKESTVLGNYLGQFFLKKDKQRIGFGIVLTKDTHDMITIFDSHFEKKFDPFCDDLDGSYKMMIKNWAKQNREMLEKDELNHESVMKDANTLNAEHNNEGWKGIRTQLEYILFQKSIKYARAVISEFEKLNKGKKIEDIISTYGLDESLANTYRNFAGYIKHKYKFIAEILLRYSDGNDCWSIWIMCMAVIHPEEWPKIDEVFKKINKGTPLSKFITEQKNDKIMAEMMAVIIDPSFKPTQF